MLGESARAGASDGASSAHDIPINLLSIGRQARPNFQGLPIPRRSVYASANGAEYFTPACIYETSTPSSALSYSRNRCVALASRGDGSECASPPHSTLATFHRHGASRHGGFLIKDRPSLAHDAVGNRFHSARRAYRVRQASAQRRHTSHKAGGTANGLRHIALPAPHSRITDDSHAAPICVRLRRRRS